MTSQPGLLHEDMLRAEVINRMHPPTPLFPILVDGLRRIGRALLEVADAMLAPTRTEDR